MNSERSNSEKKLREEVAELKKKFSQVEESTTRYRKEFMANITHELRTPLNGVLGMLGLLEDTPLNSDQTEFVDVAKNSAETLMHAIDNILNFSALEHEEPQLKNIAFDLLTLLESLERIYLQNNNQNNIQFKWHVHSGAPVHIKGDPERLRQILNCLVGNAFKFTRQGKVTLNVAAQKQIFDSQEQAVLTFTVTDTGIGIPADKLEDLFIPFMQLDGSSTRRFGGTGIGLAIAKRLVNLMGGEISVESDVGIGSTFKFTAKFFLQKSSENSVNKVASDLSGKRILVVDDNSTNRRLLKHLLESWKCRFDEAEDAFSTLEMLESAHKAGDPFDIVILDMQLQDMDGETLGKVILQDSDLKNAILVMLTSIGQRGDAERLQKVGFAAYLPKPLDNSILHQCLLSACHWTGMENKQIITRHTIAEFLSRNNR